MERAVKQYPGYLLPPVKEGCSNEKEGPLPEWIDVAETDHLLCETGEVHYFFASV